MIIIGKKFHKREPLKNELDTYDAKLRARFFERTKDSDFWRKLLRG